jgi:hypothetical protein
MTFVTIVVELWLGIKLAVGDLRHFWLAMEMPIEQEQKVCVVDKNLLVD